MKAKNGWFQSDCVSDTTGVRGSVNQCHAAIAVHTDTTARSTAKRSSIKGYINKPAFYLNKVPKWVKYLLNNLK